ncbi:MAG: hypothetical protein ABW000_06065 [Actinoplanes sp.]
MNAPCRSQQAGLNYRDRVPDDRCSSLHPDLIPRTGEPGRASRCHLAHPAEVFAADVLPRLP